MYRLNCGEKENTLGKCDSDEILKLTVTVFDVVLFFLCYSLALFSDSYVLFFCCLGTPHNS